MREQVVYKYTFPHGSSVATFEMPQGAELLTCGLQHFIEPDGTGTVLVLWARCDVDAPKAHRQFVVAATGERLAILGIYVGTVIDGPLVWHVFEVKDPE